MRLVDGNGAMADRVALVSEYIQRMAALLGEVDPAPVSELVDLLLAAWNSDRAVLVCGNGGSASTASHMALDLSKQTLAPGRPPLRALALTDNLATVTAWANDAGYSRVFAEQLLVHGRQGDVLVALSASGNSPSVVAAVKQARDAGMSVVGIGGFDGGQLASLSDVYVHVPSHDYGFVESAHLVLEHCVTGLVADAARERGVPATTGTDKPTVFIDRDGVVNRNLERGVLSWEEFEFLPGALEAIASLSAAGHPLVILTNQANINRGLLSPAQLADIHRRMEAAIIDGGGAVAGIYVCEHLPDAGCDCRRPAPGLLLRAAQDLGFDLANAYFVGDHHTDVAAARTAGVQPIFVLSGRGRLDEVQPGVELVADDLRQAAQLVLARSKAETRAGKPA